MCVCIYCAVIHVHTHISNSTIYHLNPYMLESEKGRLLKIVLEQQALMDTYGPSIYNCKSCLYDLKKKIVRSERGRFSSSCAPLDNIC